GSFAGFPYIEPTVGRPWPLPQSETPGDGYMTVDPTNFTFQATGESCDILTKAFQRYQSIIFSHENPTMHKPRNQKKRVSENLIGEGQLTSLNVNLALACEDYPYLNMYEQYELKLYSNFGLPKICHSAKGAWSDIHVYTSQDIDIVVNYARDLGIRVIPEFDTPGHTRSWGEGQPGLLTTCYRNETPVGTYGPIDPSNEENFVFLQNLFQEIASRFPDHYLHLGGDEVPFTCWSKNVLKIVHCVYIIVSQCQHLDQRNKIFKSKINNVRNNLHLYHIFDIIEQNRSQANNFYVFLRNTSSSAYLPYIVWEEVFDNGVQIAPDTVVHVWKHSSTPILFYSEIASVTAAGYQALLSSCWYLNLIEYGSDWQKFYDCDPQGFDGTDEQKSLVLGGEACMWAEYIDETNVISTMWPRAAPVAERLWSNKNDTISADEASPRLEEHRCRLFRRGYAVEPLGPSYCSEVL
ncbi:Beta-hexosaminidase subunit alpha, partial [Armadillidium vulgare]